MPEMTPRERLLTTLRGGKADRVPLVLEGAGRVSRSRVDAIEDAPWREICQRVYDQTHCVRSCNTGVNRYLVTPSRFMREASLAEGDGEVEVTVEVETPKGPLTAVTGHHIGVQTTWTKKYPVESLADIDKIRMPQVTHDAAASERDYQALSAVIGDVLPVEKRGEPGFWFSPWDELIRWWGVERAMTDLVDKPALVHAAMDRLVSAYLHRLDQYESNGLLSRNDGNVRIGSGGLGYSSELPQPDFSPDRVRCIDLWGAGTAQIFAAVSPRMHEEFALQYERRWMSRFGLNYYGCCEPLDLKIDMLRSVPSLRKISMSPWVNLDRAARNMGDAYVFSFKPSPSAFAEHTWNLDTMRQQLVAALEKTRGCVVEVIMKDISTVRYEPQRLWEWAAMAREVTEAFAP